MNILEHRATGVGKTDDTVVIQQLFAPHTTSLLYFPEDQICFDKTLNIFSNKVLRFKGVLRVCTSIHYNHDYYELLYSNDVENRRSLSRETKELFYVIK